MIKSRRTPLISSILGYEFDRNLNSKTWYGPSTDHFREEVTDSTNHPDYKREDDVGGYFSHKITEYNNHGSGQVKVSAIAGGSNPFLSYTGQFVCSLAPSFSSMPLGDGDAWGSAAYNRMLPTKPVNPLFNMVYELKDLASMARSLKSFWEFKLGDARRDLSKRFLEQTFGWQPLVSDVMRLVNTQAQVSKRIEWLIRNNGKWTSRRVTMKDETNLTQSDWTYDYAAIQPLMVTQMYVLTPKYRDSLYVRDKVWATAQFKYFLPDVPLGLDPRFVLKRRLQGNYVSVDQIYAAIPWTWLVDWALNLSQVLENTGSGVADRICARRFFIMREQERVKIRQASALMRGYGGSTVVPIECSAWQRDLNQSRIRGSPFYPVNPNALSGMQYAILGAIGASRY
jgi:hypothetical protein